MKDVISGFEFMYCGKGKVCQLALTLFVDGGGGGG